MRSSSGTSSSHRFEITPRSPQNCGGVIEDTISSLSGARIFNPACGY